MGSVMEEAAIIYECGCGFHKNIQRNSFPLTVMQSPVGREYTSANNT